MDLITLTIDGKDVTVAKGTLIIRAAEQVGVEIPRFCDHPYLAPAGACRQCYVQIEGQPKLATSCTVTVAPGMVVSTQNTSDLAREAQVANLEFLLLNHPLDCPVCDRGGECPLQDQVLAFGPGESRFTEAKRVFPSAASCARGARASATRSAGIGSSSCTRAGRGSASRSRPARTCAPRSAGTSCRSVRWGPSRRPRTGSSPGPSI
jgi:NADH-quinone oxidoreductase subunit G